jgi:hypothetical protein
MLGRTLHRHLGVSVCEDAACIERQALSMIGGFTPALPRDVCPDTFGTHTKNGSVERRSHFLAILIGERPNK